MTTLYREMALSCAAARDYLNNLLDDGPPRCQLQRLATLPAIMVALPRQQAEAYPLEETPPDPRSPWCAA